MDYSQPALVLGWFNVADVEPALIQHWLYTNCCSSGAWPCQRDLTRRVWLLSQSNDVLGASALCTVRRATKGSTNQCDVHHVTAGHRGVSRKKWGGLTEFRSLFRHCLICWIQAGYTGSRSRSRPPSRSSSHLCNADILLYKPWRPKGFFQFEIIINVLVYSVRFIWILLCYGSTAIINSSFFQLWDRQILTFKDVWRFNQVFVTEAVDSRQDCYNRRCAAPLHLLWSLIGLWLVNKLLLKN